MVSGACQFVIAHFQLARVPQLLFSGSQLDKGLLRLVEITRINQAQHKPDLLDVFIVGVKRQKGLIRMCRLRPLALGHQLIGDVELVLTRQDLLRVSLQQLKIFGRGIGQIAPRDKAGDFRPESRDFVFLPAASRSADIFTQTPSFLPVNGS